MAGLAEVSSALCALIAQIAYPNGTSQPSITGQPILVYGGWPSPGTLTTDLKAGKAHVSVYPTTEKIIDSAVSDWRQMTAPVNTLTLTTVDQTVTVGGAIPSPFSPQNLVVFVEGVPYLYSAQAADTLTSIATALAALIAVNHPGTTSAGAVITIAGTLAIAYGGLNVVLADGSAVFLVGDVPPVFGRVGGVGTSIRELRRQERTFQITVWANCFDARDPLADALDAALSGTFHLTLPDGMLATLRYRGSRQDDSGQKESIYRRDLMYAVEFSTTQATTDTQITVTETNVSGGPSLDAQFPIATLSE